MNDLNPDILARNNEDASADTTRPMLYVGVGASAGGLEALREFFAAMPDDSGMSFIIVQHLAPDYKSLMGELLARNTGMPVEIVVDGVQVERDQIYLIPPRRNLMLAEGKLYLSEQMEENRVNRPIDVFFRSLADDARHRSAAVVMSGTGSDGTRGIKAIKEAGGLVLVQDPDTAQFDGMPYSAVSTGLADFVLESAKLAEYLVSYIRHPLVAGTDNSLRRKLKNNDRVLEEVFALLRRDSRIDFSHYKPSTVARRIERRMGINQIVDLIDYYNLLRESDREIDTLGRELLINVTRFFRDTDAFEHVEKDVVRRMVERAGEREQIRVWVAGCSTGEEAYSIAILIDETIQRLGLKRSAKIFATDVDEAAINEASSASFSADIAADISSERLQRYFRRQENGYTLKSEIRQMVVFATHNMITDPPFSNMDLISCRNVLIYFQHAIQQKVLAAFNFSLKQGGVLFLGHSESIGELKTYFDVVNERFRVFRKSGSSKVSLSSTQRGVDKIGAATMPRANSLPPVSNLLRGYRGAQREPNIDHVKDRLLTEFVPPCLVLDAEHNAVHVYGDASKFLTRFPTGRVSTNLHDIISKELRVPVSTALSRAENESTTVYYSNVPAEIAGEQQLFDVQTEFFPGKNGRPAYYSLIIRERSEDEDADGRHARIGIEHSDHTQQRIHDLENELLNSREHLQITNEELETTNEELQAANEELMSSNEELQSSNEELQSVNEELFTVNHEFQEKIAELSVANDDLDNVLSFTSTGIVFLDQDMRIRKFTEVSSHVFNLLPTDVGRPLHHISHDLVYPRLFQDIAEVTLGAASVGRHVKTKRGHEIFLRINPYSSDVEHDRTKLRGVILTLSNVLPRDFEDSEPEIDGEPDRDPEPAKHLRVLVLDDSESDRLVLKRHLSLTTRLEIDIVEASNVRDAVAELRTTRIDACLVDYRLGLDTAEDFAAAAASHRRKVPTIVMSGFTRAELKDDLADSSLTHFLNKQEMSPQVLELALINALEVHEAELENASVAGDDGDA